MENLEKQYDDDFLYRMWDEVLKRVEKSEEFQELSQKADALSDRFPVITELFEGDRLEERHELTKEERQAVRNYVEIQSRMIEMYEFAHYYRGHGDCMLHLGRCGLLEENVKSGMDIETMTGLIHIHDAYKAFNKALLGTEMTLMFYEGNMGALGRIYEVIDKNVPEKMKPVSTEILANTSVDAGMRAKMLLLGEDQ